MSKTELQSVSIKIVMIADTLLIQKSSVYCYGFLNFIGKEKIYC